jgi:cobalt-zinc-cadmium resistance protein CzcA
LIVRATNYLTSIEDIKNIPIMSENGYFLRMSDVADVEVGEVPNRIGFIAVFGIATLNGVVLISYIRQLIFEGKTVDEAINIATRLRLRPILITATASSLGLIPILLSGDIGSETQKPIAIVVIGGIFTSTMLTLLILPIVYRMFNKGA